jgi:5'-3' exonuclease
MDCNSIVYDAYRDLQEQYKKSAFDLSTLEKRLIELTIHRICDYICNISPDKLVYITFDGVAPLAKMEQQRTRRHKTAFSGSTSDIWNTANITPGTEFMKKLSASVTHFFSKPHERLQHLECRIRTSCSDEPGEGEHKLFQYLRENDCTDDVVTVYGLDADLIMLSILHTEYVKEIYVFREAPNFKTVISCDYQSGQSLFMDIHGLFNCIFKEMGNYDPICKQMRVHDYIFMCFLLGNDFLPHFPALNIRVHGIQILMDTYNQTIGKYTDKSFIHPITKKISWNHVKSFIAALASKEHHYIKKESADRDKWDHRKWASSTPLDIEQLVLNAPMIYRSDEKYICPSEPGWEARYYKRLLNIQPTSSNIHSICTNYLEGLEWVYKYYTAGCVSWKWKYNGHYPPLLVDLVKYIPISMHEFIINDHSSPVSPEEQLRYVMPTQEKKEILHHWGYKRYHWESELTII